MAETNRQIFGFEEGTDLADIQECPRKNGGMEPCVLVRCRKHVIHLIYSDKEMNSRSDEEIAEKVALLRESCMVDLLQFERFCPEHYLEEIADELGISKKTLKEIYFKALRKIRSRMEALIKTP